MDVPTWEEFAEGTQPRFGEEGQEPTLPRHGWQKRAHQCLSARRCVLLCLMPTEPWPDHS